jgi:DNA-binding GntR family transcriptional regulator
VSRATLREALRSLEEDGYVTRRRGAGTYVVGHPRLRNNLDVNFGVTDAIRASGMRPGTVDTVVSIAPASSEESEALDVAADEPLVSLERVRTADDRPVVFSRDLFARSLVTSASMDDLGEGSVYDLLEAAGHVVQHGVVTLEPMKAGRAMGRRLKIDPGSLVLYLRQIDYGRDGQPVLLSHEYHVADAFEFSVLRRGPGQGQGGSVP